MTTSSRSVAIAAAASLVVALSGGATATGARSLTASTSTGRIVFARHIANSNYANVFISHPDGTHVHGVPLRYPLEGGGGAVWSPNGTKLLLTNIFPTGPTAKVGFRPAIINPDGSHFRLLLMRGAPSDMWCGAWSPNGKRLLCSFGGKQPGVFSVRASDGGDRVRISTNPFGGGAGDTAGDYSPDGSKIVFVRVKPGPKPNPDEVNNTAAVFVANADGSGRPRRITPYGAVNAHDFGAVAHWSPDGLHIIFGSATTSQPGVIGIVHPDGTSRTSLDLGAFPEAPGWSPDGAKIVFTMFVGQETDIFTANNDGTGVFQLTHTKGRELAADWGR
jgi:Tol biopolymer transport system component